MFLLLSDVESVLIPEIWVEISEKLGIKELAITSREIPDFERLMRYRIEMLKKYGIKFGELERIARALKPLPYAKTFLKNISMHIPVILVSGAPYELLCPVLKKLGSYSLIANNFIIKNGEVDGFKFRIREDKENVVRFFKKLNYRVIGIGDSFNDISMLNCCEYAFLLNPSEEVKRRCQKAGFKGKIASSLKEIEREIKCYLKLYF